MQQVYCSVFDEAIDNYLNDGIIETKENQTVARFMQFTGLPQAVLNANQSLEKVVQSKVLQDILQGKVPTPNIKILGDFPFLLGKGENLIWLFRNITFTNKKYNVSSWTDSWYEFPCYEGCLLSYWWF